MKKWLSLLLAGVLTLGLAACGGNHDNDTEADQRDGVTAMTAPIDSLARCMLENDLTYAPADPDFVWTALYYFSGGYGAQDDRISQNDSYQLEVPAAVMAEYTAVLFADAEGLTPLPSIMQGNISYEPEADVYLVSMGDIGLSETRLTNVTETEDGATLTAELWATDEDPALMAAWEVTLTKAPESETDARYPYRVVSMERVTDGDPSAPTDAEIPADATTATAVFNGFSDAHTVEVTLPDDTVQAFQFDADTAVQEALNAMQAGDGFTFAYVTDANGAAKIVSIQ